MNKYDILLARFFIQQWDNNFITPIYNVSIPMINANDIGMPIDKAFWYYLLNLDLKLSDSQSCLKIWNSRFLSVYIATISVAIWAEFYQHRFQIF